MQILLFLVPIIMYGVWRVSADARGEDSQPVGRQYSRTDAMSQYLEETKDDRHPPRGWALVGMIAFVVVWVGLILWFLVWAISRAER